MSGEKSGLSELRKKWFYLEKVEPDDLSCEEKPGEEYSPIKTTASKFTSCIVWCRDFILPGLDEADEEDFYVITDQILDESSGFIEAIYKLHGFDHGNLAATRENVAVDAAEFMTEKLKQYERFVKNPDSVSEWLKNSGNT